MRKNVVILCLLALFVFADMSSQENDQLLNKINGLHRIAGSVIGRNDQTSEEYKIFEALEQLSTYDVVKIYEETTNPIGKIFCCWALKERKYANYTIYSEYLKNLYSHVQIETQWYGEVVENEQLTKVIDYNFRKLWSGKK